MDINTIQTAFLIAITFHLVYCTDYLFGLQTLDRPIVAAPIMGLVLGDLETGLIMGASLEAIYMGISAIGGSVPAEPASGSMLSVAFVIIGGVDMNAALALSLPIGTAIGAVKNLTMPIHAFFTTYFRNLAATGQTRKFSLSQFLYNFTFRIGFVTIVIFFSVAFGIDKVQVLLYILPDFVMKGLSVAGGMLPAVGFGILTSMIWSPKLGAYFFLGFVLVKYLAMPTVAIAIIGGIIAVIGFFRDMELKELQLVRANSNQQKSTAKDEEDFFA